MSDSDSNPREGNAGANAPTHTHTQNVSSEENASGAPDPEPAAPPPSSEPEPSPGEPAWDLAACEALFDTWRGRPLSRLPASKQQAYREAEAQLVAEHSREFVECLREAMIAVPNANRDTFFGEKMGGIVEPPQMVAQGPKWYKAAQDLVEARQQDEHEQQWRRDDASAWPDAPPATGEAWSGLPPDSPLARRQAERKRREQERAQQDMPPSPLPGRSDEEQRRLLQETTYVREQLDKLRAGMRLTPTSRGIIFKKLRQLAEAGITDLASEEELASLSPLPREGTPIIVEAGANVVVSS